MDPEPIIRWQLDTERRFPFGGAPDPAWFEPIGYLATAKASSRALGVMVASANGIVAWHRSGPDDDPVLGVLGGDDRRPVRIADRRHMRRLRCYGDVAIGAQTLREQPRLLQTPQEPDDPPMPALYEFRHAHGLPAQPRHVIYSLGGCLDIAMPVFNTPGVEAINVPTETGAADLRACGAPARGVDLIVDALEDTDGLRRAHARLFAERGVRYLACEGGQTVLAALRRAGLLDEVFVTETDVTVDVSRHSGDGPARNACTAPTTAMPTCCPTLGVA